MSPKVPRDAAFRATVLNLADLYTRQLGPHERVLSLDEKTSMQPRPRTKPTRPALPDGVPVRVEHEYNRAGALNLLAAFDMRTGEVIGICRRRKHAAPPRDGVGREMGRLTRETMRPGGEERGNVHVLGPMTPA